MFFDKGNCLTVRKLHEVSQFLEASLEKLVSLEQEALLELKTPPTNQRQESNKQVNVKSSVHQKMKNSDRSNLKESISIIPAGTLNESVGSFDKNLCSNTKNEMTIISNHPSLNSSEKFLKRSFKPAKLSDDFVTDSYSNKFQKTVHLEPNLEIVEADNNSELNVSADFINSEEASNDSYQIAHPPDLIQETITDIGQYFKILIKFKASRSFEEVEECIKSVGLDEPFDIVITKKKAEITFLNESSMKKALELPQSAMDKLGAYLIKNIKD